MNDNRQRRSLMRATLMASVAVIGISPLSAAGIAGPQPAAVIVADPAVQATAQPAEGAAPTPQAEPTSSAAEEALQDVVVTGARATQRNSIQVKRDASVILDGIVNDEIGAQPDNSVGDTLERITGVSADRFKGNANELSVRGLGPTLSFATFNGREVSSAGADRSVAFQQFPSELVNGVIVYKTQQADFLEGGIGGVIELRSLKPLEYGKRRFQAELRGDYSPKDDAIMGRSGTGYRFNASYVDQFHTGIGDFGVSIGVQHQDTTAPEDYYTGNSAFVPCSTSANNGTLATGTTAQLNAAGASQNCAQVAAPRTGIGETVGGTYFATQSRTWRQTSTREERNAVIGTLEWRPAPNFDIAIDGQYSKRNSTENRNNFAIAEALRGITPILVGDGTNGFSKGALIKYSGNSNLEDQLELRERDEEYIGGGLSANWRSDRLTISADGSYSGSHRTETQKATRMRSTTRVGYTLDYGDDVVPTVTFNNFDITNPANFAANAANAVYARNRLATDRRDEIWAGRADAEYSLGDGWLSSIKIGGRYSDHHRTNDNARNNDLNTLVNVNGLTPAQLIGNANGLCRTPFPSSSFFNTTGSNVTNWATFDNDCLFRTFTGSDTALPYPTDGRDPSDLDIRERITAAYAMANFKGDLGDTPVSGNFGLRYVKTDITSIGYRTPIKITIDPNADSYSVVADPAGAITTTTLKGGYSYWLPSANVAFDLSSTAKLRFALYRALSRSPIESFGAGLALNPSAGTGASNIVFNATTGNPDLKPLRAWNADVSMEFYFSKDSLLSVAAYYKWLRGAVINATTTIPEQITATTTVGLGAPTVQTYTINPVAPANDPFMRHLYGIEITGSHAFSYLPSPLDGFGVSGSYNLAFANFEFADTSALAPYLEPENLIGMSRHVASGTIYWEKWGFSLRASYRYRSHYYKPNSSTNRSVQDAGYLNLSAQYDLTKNIQLKLQAQNVTNTKDVFYKGGYDSVAEVSESGPVYYAGVRVRF
jgi:iron complex outermembrane receptor protein